MWSFFEVKSLNARHGTNSYTSQFLNNKWVANRDTVSISVLRFFQLHSQYTPSKIYNAWIKYSNSCFPLIFYWYYQCKIGKHAIRYCSHVVFVLWYKSARAEIFRSRPIQKLYLPGSTQFLQNMPIFLV